MLRKFQSFEDPTNTALRNPSATAAGCFSSPLNSHDVIFCSIVFCCHDESRSSGNRTNPFFLTAERVRMQHKRRRERKESGVSEREGATFAPQNIQLQRAVSQQCGLFAAPAAPAKNQELDSMAVVRYRQ